MLGGLGRPLEGVKGRTLKRGVQGLGSSGRTALRAVRVSCGQTVLAVWL